MDNKELLDISKNFPEINTLIVKVNSIKKELNKTTRQLNTLKKKYSFLKTLVDIGTNDDKLEESLKQYFKELGYKDVRKVGKKYQKEDLLIWKDNKLIIFEIKGIVRPTPKENYCGQIAKYLNLRRNEHKDKEVFGLFVVNHDNGKHFSIRNKTPFDKDKIKYANAGKYGLTTTLDLFIAFCQIKAGKLKINEFEKRICSWGLIKFGSCL